MHFSTLHLALIASLATMALVKADEAPTNVALITLFGNGDCTGQSCDQEVDQYDNDIDQCDAGNDPADLPDGPGFGVKSVMVTSYGCSRDGFILNSWGRCSGAPKTNGDCHKTEDCNRYCDGCVSQPVNSCVNVEDYMPATQLSSHITTC